MILCGKKLRRLISKEAEKRKVSESEIRKDIKQKLNIKRHTLSNWEHNWKRIQKSGKPYNPTLQHLYELQWYFELPNFKGLIRE